MQQHFAEIFVRHLKILPRKFHDLINETQINLRGKELNPSIGEMIEILHEYKADHSGVASDQIGSPAFEDADVFAKFGHQTGIVLDKILHKNIC